jgi:hypothetical protein
MRVKGEGAIERRSDVRLTGGRGREILLVVFCLHVTKENEIS